MTKIKERLNRLFSPDRLYPAQGLHVEHQEGVPRSLVNDANFLLDSNYKIVARTPNEAAEKLVDLLFNDAHTCAQHYAQYSATDIQAWNSATKNGDLWEDTVIGGYRSRDELDKALEVLPTKTKRQLH